MPVNIQLMRKSNPQIKSLDFDILLAYATSKSKEFLFTHPEYKLSLRERLRLAYFLFLYKRGYSVAAITHHKEFYGLDFYVNRHTLIPRPETELLVDEAITAIKNPPSQGGSGGCWLIDVGTGSGCIPIAIATGIRKSGLSGYLDKIFAIDISQKALQVAHKNAQTHNISINFLQGSLLEPILQHPPTPLPGGINHLAIQPFNYSTIIITANLPYLTPDQFKNESSIRREPRSALVAEGDGLALYEQLLHQLASFISLFPYFSISVFLEIDPSQTERIKQLIKTYLPSSTVEIKPDLAGRDRVVKIQVINS